MYGSLLIAANMHTIDTMGKNPPAVWETQEMWVWPPGGGNNNPLQYSCLENAWMEEAGGLQSPGDKRVRRDWATEHTHTHLLY